MRGLKDPLSDLQTYKPKIQNTMEHYLNEKRANKWYIGMKVIMQQIKKGDEEVQEADPWFTLNPVRQLLIWDFDENYKVAGTKIENDFVAFNANGSGWILNKVELVSMHNCRCAQPVIANDLDERYSDSNISDADSKDGCMK